MPDAVPRDDRCRQILDQYQVPPHIRRHSEMVARIAFLLAKHVSAMQGGEPDPLLVRAAGLLHDICKMTCLENHKDHAAEGGQQLHSLGLNEVGELVRRHVHLGQWDPEGPVTGAEIVNYSDKRVRHEEIVSLRERFADLHRRYGRGRPEVDRRITADEQVILRVEQKIFGRLSFDPDQIASMVKGAVWFSGALEDLPQAKSTS